MVSDGWLSIYFLVRWRRAHGIRFVVRKDTVLPVPGCLEKGPTSCFFSFREKVMGDHLNEREIVPHVESCRELNKRLLDYPRQRKDKETKLDFRRKFGSATHPNIPGVREGPLASQWLKIEGTRGLMLWARLHWINYRWKYRLKNYFYLHWSQLRTTSDHFQLSKVLEAQTYCNCYERQLQTQNFKMN